MGSLGPLGPFQGPNPGALGSPWPQPMLEPLTIPDSPAPGRESRVRLCCFPCKLLLLGRFSRAVPGTPGIISCWSSVGLSGWHKLQHPYFYFSLHLKGTYERNLTLAGPGSHKHSVNKLCSEISMFLPETPGEPAALANWKQLQRLHFLVYSGICSRAGSSQP